MNAPFIYLDYAASSPVDPEVTRVMCECLASETAFANPSSEHAAGAAARRLIDAARRQVASRVHAPAGQIVFTSGATEANNLALKGLFAGAAGGAHAARPLTDRHLITTRIEHRSVLDPARALAAAGARLTLLDCTADGRIEPAAVAAAIRDETALVSVMHVNNEVGVVQDVAAIAAECRSRGVLFHTDAAQSTGKLPVDLLGWDVDLCSLSAHKLCGPKGVGALYVREGLRLEPLLHGGEQELGMRAGTLATHQIVGMGKAYALADPGEEGPRLAALTARLWERLRPIDGAVRNGAAELTAPHILNVSFPGIDGESLRLALDGLVVSSGSACTSASPDASHVLTSLGLSEARAQGSLRFGVGRFTTRDEVDEAARRVRAEVERLRLLAVGKPDWCSA